jgi:hypothetical protein
MSKLLSGSKLRAGGSNEFITLETAQPQLPPSPTTSTGFTLVTDSLLRTSYRSSLGNLEINSGTVYSNLPDGMIRLAGTGTGFVYVTSSTASTSTTTGALVVKGGVGVGGSMNIEKDIVVNGITVGQGFQGVNNIVVRGIASPQINDFSIGQASIAIGNDSLLGLSSAYKSIAIGNYALSSGTEVRNSIAIGDSTLKLTGSISYLPLASITAISKANPIVVEAIDHKITTGTHIIITNVLGMTEINSLHCYAKPISTYQIALYSNVNVSVPVNGTAFTTYSSGGTVSRLLERDNNIGIGNNAGSKLIDGKQNFLFGDGVAANLTTGSYNFFIGHEVGQNITTGSGIIAIGGDNIVNGVDNQVNIGSVFYYNGRGNLELMADVEVGLGTPCGPDGAALTVIGGANIQDNLCVDSTETSTSTTSGAVVVAGGAGFVKDVFIGHDLTVLGVIHGAINTTTNIRGGARGSIPYQTATDVTILLPIGNTNTVLISNGNVPYWADVTGLAQTGGASTASNAILVNPTTATHVYYLGLTDVIGTYSPEFSDAKMKYVTSATTTSSYYSSGTNLLTVPGNIYSASGNPDEGNLLYSPRVHVGASPPTDPRVGDMWVDTVNAVELQWIKDNTNYFWIQFTGL